MPYVLSNLSDESLRELNAEVLNERKRRFLLKDWSNIKDDKSLSKVERILSIHRNNPGVGLMEARWIVEGVR